jgi:Leucine-rich repeat (LRR) protein
MAPNTLSPESFSLMTKLEKVSLKHNLLFQIPCHVLSSSPKLHYIDLSFNDITDFKHYTFCGAFDAQVSGEKVLILSHNGSAVTPRKTTYFYPGAFAGVVSLDQLFMKNMGIKELPQGIFDEMTSLKVLDLSDNYLTNFEFLMDSRVTQTLITLDVSRTMVKTFPSGFWKGFKKLEVLKMERMSLHSLPDIQSLKKLRELHFCNQFLKDKVSSWLLEAKRANPQMVIKECSF